MSYPCISTVRCAPDREGTITMKTIRIALLDDHAVVRHGLANTLAAEANFEVVGIYEKSRDLMPALLRHLQTYCSWISLLIPMSWTVYH